jgi:hypothetical protein
VPVGETVAGIFITNGPAMSVQEFDLANLTDEDTKSIFLSFEEKTNRFSDIYVGRRKLAIRGGFSLLLGDSRISLSESGGVPYLTVVDNWQAKLPSMLGYIGTTDIFSLSGKKSLKLLEAHNVANDIEQNALSYKVNDRYELVLGERPITVDYVGLVVNRENACFEQEAFVVDPISSRKIFHSKEMQSQVAKGLLSGLSEDRRYFSSLLFLRESKKALIGLDLDKAEIAIVQRFPSTKIVCVIRTLKLESLKQQPK